MNKQNVLLVKSNPLAQSIKSIFNHEKTFLNIAGSAFLLGYIGFNQTASAIDVSELDGSNGFVVSGLSNVSQGLGKTIHNIGDINGDSVSDFLVESAGDFLHSARSHIIFGDAGTQFPADIDINQLNGDNGFTVTGNFIAHADINNDGNSDLIFGTERNRPQSNFVVLGRNTAAQGKFDANINSSNLVGNNGFRLGDPANQGLLTVTSPGDVSGDGIDDIILMEADYDSDYPSATVKSIYVVFGSADPAGFAADISLSQLDGQDGFRIQNAFIDKQNLTNNQYGGYTGYNEYTDLNHTTIDFNGDGINEMVTTNRRVYGHYYSNSERADITIISELAVNGDFPAVVENLNRAETISISSVSTYIESVDFAGDINGDGIDDISLSSTDYYGVVSTLISFGAERNSAFEPGERESVLRFVSGFYGPQQSLGDINGDGIDDLLLNIDVGVANYNAPENAAQVILLGRSNQIPADFNAGSGNLDYFTGDNGFILTDSVPDGFGYGYDFKPTAAGDVNGDGINDILISDPNQDTINGYNAGRTHIVFSQNGGFADTVPLNPTNPSDGFVIDGPTASFTGRALDTADINGDGADDVLVRSKGDVYVVFGTPDQTVLPMLACPGDVNGNGSQDFAVLVKDQQTGTLNAVIKDANGTAVSQIEFNHNFHPAGLKSIADINNNQSPELVVIDQTTAKAEIRDSLTGQLLNSTGLHANGGVVDLATVVDQNGNGTEELVSLNNKGRVTVKDSLTSQALHTLNFSSDFYTPVDLSVFNSLPPKAGVLMNHNDPKKRDKVAIKDMSSGRQLMNLWYGRGWEALQLELLADINGNGAQEAAVLRETTNKFNVMIRDSQSGASLGILGYDSNYGPIKMAVSADLNNNGSDEIVVLDEHKQNGAIKASVKDSKNKKLIKKMFFNKNLIPHDLAVCPDINGNNQPEVVVLGERENNGELVLVVKDAKTGKLVGKVDF